MTDYSFHLLSRHQRLDEAIRSEQRRAWPDFWRIQKLKRLKLAVRDRLATLMRRR